MNIQVYHKDVEAEKAKGANGREDQIKKPEYDMNDPLFLNLITSLALSTTTYFSFQPDEGEVVDWYKK